MHPIAKASFFHLSEAGAGSILIRLCACALSAAMVWASAGSVARAEAPFRRGDSQAAGWRQLDLNPVAANGAFRPGL